MEKVTFPHGDITMAGGLFSPPDRQPGQKYPAIVVTHPFGAVKEQVPAVYAGQLAGHGFVTLVFDAAYQGESGGEPHFTG